MSVPAFAELLERLVFTPGRNAKLALLRDWFAAQPDPERGIGLAALTGELVFTAAKPALIRDMVASRTDPVLLTLSHDYVGDFAETVALIWPERAGTNAPAPTIAEVVEALELTPKAELPGLIAGWLDRLDASSRLALIKLITGGLRVGVSGRLARLALAEWAGKPVEEIEEVWHGVAPPYLPLFRWLEGCAERPDPRDAPVFRPLMLAHPLEDADVTALDPTAWRAEWKWDGIRVQLTAGPGGRRLWSRGGEDVSGAFPEIIAAMEFHAVLDGELLVMRDGVVAPFADLQQRLNRKSVTAKMQQDYPVGVRLYDLLFEGTEDLRPLPFDARRARLEQWVGRVAPARLDLSPQIAFASVAQLSGIRDGARAASIEGLMLKRADSPYVAGRQKGLWWKWKRDPLSIDAVLMYAQRGHGKRSSFYSDYTFGLWRPDGAGGEELVPVGKAYSGYTDAELAWLDRWIRNHTTGRFGPVREVEKALVLEVIFDAAQRSSRHKSGVALRFPRIARIRTDKPASEADRLENLTSFIEARDSRASPAR
ncbi:ATP-dependent DNA ligase [Siccirubricoccus deserti]|uniref:DNA ligase (ATP) n=1 Tax=Siccirubricoccus deserti TaxID=2013562 RepID=A0A9X0QZ71_9PROT|nr:cisplatin damage response ATP-dependent DNA ligase [Siccirubricoccus deserti]MBC4016681.1 cisplatin damage response ATP-dependent DNA ligase [Siccirubricoccus deserti]GGC51058.1 ATP-dependent DNA ligase [Siccirubricoccus deserti]